MENMTLEATINEISRAYAEMDNAKSDFNDVVQSALDAYFGEIPVEASKNVKKQIKAERKTSSKNIKKIAKAMATGEKDQLENETDSLKNLIDDIS